MRKYIFLVLLIFVMLSQVNALNVNIVDEPITIESEFIQEYEEDNLRKLDHQKVKERLEKEEQLEKEQQIKTLAPYDYWQTYRLMGIGILAIAVISSIFVLVEHHKANRHHTKKHHSIKHHIIRHVKGKFHKKHTEHHKKSVDKKMSKHKIKHKTKVKDKRSRVKKKKKR